MASNFHFISLHSLVSMFSVITNKHVIMVLFAGSAVQLGSFLIVSENWFNLVLEMSVT